MKSYALPLLFALCTAQISAADHSDITPLKTVSGDQQELQLLWRQLSQGDAQALLNMDGAMFLSDLGTSHEEHGIIEHWTRALRRRLGASPLQESAIEALDRHFAREITLHEQSRWPAIAARYLPARRAQKLLQHEADRAFDRGDFHAFTGISRLLENARVPVMNPFQDTRIEIAQDAIAQAEASPWAITLPSPGPVTPITAAVKPMFRLRSNWRSSNYRGLIGYKPRTFC